MREIKKMLMLLIIILLLCSCVNPYNPIRDGESGAFEEGGEGE